LDKFTITTKTKKKAKHIRKEHGEGAGGKNYEDDEKFEVSVNAAKRKSSPRPIEISFYGWIIWESFSLRRTRILSWQESFIVSMYMCAWI